MFGTAADPAAAWRGRAEAIRQREMRSESDGHCLAASWPGLAVRAALQAAFGEACRRVDLRPLSPNGRRLPHARGRASRAEWVGPEPARDADRANPSGGRRVRARCARRVPARLAGTRPSGAARPGGAAGRSAGRPLVRTARVRGKRDSRRCRARRRDGVAERARRRGRCRFGATARAAAKAAQRAARVLLRARARAIAAARHRGACRAAARRCSRPRIRLGGSSTSHSRAQRRTGASASRNPSTAAAR